MAQLNALEHLVDYALAAGAVISVWDGEDWGLKRSTDRQAVLTLVYDLDEAKLRFRDASGTRLGTALVVNGNEPDELVADYSSTPFLEAWDKQFLALTS